MRNDAAIFRKEAEHILACCVAGEVFKSFVDSYEEAAVERKVFVEVEVEHRCVGNNGVSGLAGVSVAVFVR